MQIYKNSLKIMSLAWVISIVLSFVIRVPGLYDRSFQWRPIQTQMTTYWFAKEGIDLVNYQTPFYGPPWQIPFEFPLFQATAAVIFKAGLGNFDFASKLTALLYFYLSAIFLYLLSRKIFSDNRTNFTILTLYLWLPYNVYYSTEALIDYLALALALAYLYFIILWLDNHSSFWNALLATMFGSLGILVKPTTMPIVAIPIIVFVLKDILTMYRDDFKQPFDLRYLLNKVWAQWFYWLTLITMAIIPVLMGNLWTRHSDLIKDNSIFTQWLTSKALVGWNFGTWELRADQNVWINYTSVAERFLLPYGLSIFVVLGIFITVGIIRSPREKMEIRLFILSIIASIGLVLTIFLHLYLHQYYYIALSASMAILGGYGLTRFWQLKQKNQHMLTFAFAVWALIFLAFNVKDYKMFRHGSINDNSTMEQLIARAQDVQRYVPVDKWIVVVESDWNPSYIYAFERKTMVITPRELGKPICRMLTDERFTLVVVSDLLYDKNVELLNFAFKCFKSKQEVLPGVFVVTH
jgi:hypothetical protein